MFELQGGRSVCALRSTGWRRIRYGMVPSRQFISTVAYACGVRFVTRDAVC